MQKISTNLWFEGQAEEAVNFYVSHFKDSEIGTISRYDDASAEVSGQRTGSVLTIDFKLMGQSFVGLNGGPQFQFNPSISFMVNCETKDEVDRLWQILSDGGEVLMPLDSYPFSERYGWLQDKYGISWQLIYTDEAANRQSIMPTLMFVGDVCGKAEDAMRLYTSAFEDANIDGIMRYEAGEEPDQAGTIKHAEFMLAGQQFAAMDSAHEHHFNFNEAISLIVDCKDQAEVDHFWNKLTDNGGEPGMCGWLKDPFGVSWQIVPSVLYELLQDEDAEKAERAMTAMLQMKKLDIAALKSAAYELA